jgi:hypothetical protein
LTISNYFKQFNRISFKAFIFALSIGVNIAIF